MSEPSNEQLTDRVDRALGHLARTRYSIGKTAGDRICDAESELEALRSALEDDPYERGYRVGFARGELINKAERIKSERLSAEAVQLLERVASDDPQVADEITAFLERVRPPSLSTPLLTIS